MELEDKKQGTVAFLKTDRLYSFSAQVRHALLVLRTAFVSQRAAEEQSALA
jgi:hypothetical protein